MSQCDLQHIDQIMSSHGKQIMQAVTLILEADHSIEVKEQVNTNTCSSTRCCWMFASCRFSAGKCQPCENWILGFFPQTLCILANIADGNTAKDLIVSNDDMLQKVKYYMVNNRTCGSHVVKVRCLALTNLVYLCRGIPMWNCSSPPPSASPTSSGTKRTVRDWPYNEWVNIYCRCQDFSLNQKLTNLTQNIVYL